MYRLFKNALFSFLKSKIATALLIIVVFVSAATFTMMQSTSYSFRRSYNQVMQNTALHDFTVNEKYSIVGKPGIEVIPKPLPKPLNKDDNYLVTFRIDKNKSTKSYKEFYEAKGAPQWVSTKSGYSKTSDPSSEPQVQSLIKNIKRCIENEIYEYQSTLSTKAIEKKYGNKVILRKVESLSVSTLNQQFKVVNAIEEENAIDKLHIFNGRKVSKTLKLKVMKENAKLLSEKIDFFKNNNTNIIHEDGKGFKYTIRSNEGKIPFITTYYDTSAFQAVVSPSYAKEHDKKTMSPSKVMELLKNIDTDPSGSTITNINKDFIDDKIKFINDHNLGNYVIWIGKVPYFITGIGVSPDFAFPIIDAANPLPNVKNQAILFVNKNGYKRIHDSFRSNPQENFLVGKFTSKFHGNKQQAIKKIDKLLRKKMSWPANIQIASDKYDTSEKINLAAQRITFLEKLNKTISIITYSTILLLTLFTAGIVIIVIKKELSGNRQMLGILMANGYSKWQIAFSMTSVAFIFTIIPCALGYTVGHFLQYAFINLFKDYWTIPVEGNRFSFISLITTVALPLIGITALAIVFTFVELNKPLVRILSNSETNTGGFLSNKVSKIFFWIGIRFKTSLTLITSNGFKMLLALFATFMIIVTGGIAIASFGKFDTAMKASTNRVNYKYKVDLLTPTVEGGNMNAITLDHVGTRGEKSITELDSNSYMETFKKAYNGEQGNSYVHIPSAQDAANLKYENISKLKGKHPNYLHFLDNKIQFKSLLDVSMSGINPWDIARNKMPSNQQNIADEKAKEFIDMARDVPKNAYLKWNKWNNNAKFWMETADWQVKKGKLNDNRTMVIAESGGKGHYYVSDSAKYNSGGLTLADEYKKFIFNALEYAIKNYGNKDAIPKVHLPYFISYRNIILNKRDELFTSIKATYNGNSFAEGSQFKNISILGINPNSKMVNLHNDEWNKLNNFNKDSDVIPVVANEYFVKTFGLKVGSTIDINITNTADHHIKGNKKAKAKIVAIDKTYNGIKLYTLRNYANKALSLNKTLSDSESIKSGQNKYQYFNNDKKPFNGVFTKESNPLVFNTLGIYSETNIYIGEDTISNNSNDSMYRIVEQYLNSNNWKNKSKVNNMEQFFAMYGHSPLGAAFANAEWISMSDYAFKSILNLSNKLIWMIEAIALILSLLFVGIISMMIISDNKKFISSLKVMGYKNSEIRKIFLGSFIPSLLFGIILAIPFVGGILFVIEKLIIDFGNVLVPLEMIGWEIPLAVGVLIISFSLIYFASMRQLKNTNMLQAFKV